MTEQEALAAAAAAAGLPTWVMVLGGILGSAALTLILRLGNKAGTADKAEATKVAGMARFGPETEQRSLDVIATTVGALDLKTDRIEEKVDEVLEIVRGEKREREEDERDELRELRRMARRIDPSREG